MSIMRHIILKFRGEIDIEALKIKGLMVGKDTFINFGCVIDESFCHLIEIGSRVTFAPGVHVLAHDASTKKALGYTKIGCVKVGDDVFVGAGSIILPNVTIGNNVVIGAGSVVTRNVPNNSVVLGVPARYVCSYDEYMKKEKLKMESQPIYDFSYTISGGITKQQKEQMKKELTISGGGYIV